MERERGGEIDGYVKIDVKIDVDGGIQTPNEDNDRRQTKARRNKSNQKITNDKR